jgi:hypothetical protein
MSVGAFEYIWGRYTGRGRVCVRCRQFRANGWRALGYPKNLMPFVCLCCSPARPEGDVETCSTREAQEEQELASINELAGACREANRRADAFKDALKGQYNVENNLKASLTEAREVARKLFPLLAFHPVFDEEDFKEWVRQYPWLEAERT